jgi:hypothetical protein
MQKIAQVLAKIIMTMQTVADALINLAFQPLITVGNIIVQSVDIWTPEDAPEDEKSPSVTVYPSTNEGRIAEECNYPIGFHINSDEAEQINQIKEQLK